jgi:hypothetical protein
MHLCYGSVLKEISWYANIAKNNEFTHAIYQKMSGNEVGIELCFDFV